MINFSLNTCWRLIPTKLQKNAKEVTEIQSLPFFYDNDIIDSFRNSFISRCLSL